MENSPEDIHNINAIMPNVLLECWQMHMHYNYLNLGTQPRSSAAAMSLQGTQGFGLLFR